MLALARAGGRTATCTALREFEEASALAEGENDSLAGWRADHREYLERNGGFDPNMMLVCERVRLIEDLAEATGEATNGDVQSI